MRSGRIRLSSYLPSPGNATARGNPCCEPAAFPAYSAAKLTFIASAP
jgi:hypothetical protein